MEAVILFFSESKPISTASSQPSLHHQPGLEAINGVTYRSHISRTITAIDLIDAEVISSLLCLKEISLILTQVQIHFEPRTERLNELKHAELPFPTRDDLISMKAVGFPKRLEEDRCRKDITMSSLSQISHRSASGLFQASVKLGSDMYESIASSFVIEVYGYTGLSFIWVAKTPIIIVSYMYTCTQHHSVRTAYK